MVKIIKPRSEAEIAELIGRAYGEKSAIQIIGGASRDRLGYTIDAPTTISTAHHKGISLYEPEALTIIAKAGTPLRDVEKILNKNGQRLPFEPMGHHTIFGNKYASTIGGVAACNISGSRRILAGACRDSLIGVRFVNGCGEIIKNGGRVMKNVTGLDLVKLMCGSHGTLGVITEVAFKVLPVSERAVSFAIEGLSVAEGVGFLIKTLSTPYEISGAAYLPSHMGKSLTVVRVEGFSDQVDYRINCLRKIDAADANANIIEGRTQDKLWQSIRNVEAFCDKQKALWRISTKPSLAAKIHDILKEKFGGEFLLDWGGGLIWWQMNMGDHSMPADVRKLLGEFGAQANLVRVPASNQGQVEIFQPQPKRIAEISEAIRQKFDPAGILNPGRLTGTGHSS